MTMSHRIRSNPVNSQLSALYHRVTGQSSCVNTVHQNPPLTQRSNKGLFHPVCKYISNLHPLFFALPSGPQGVKKGSHDATARLADLPPALLVLTELLQVASGWPAQPLHLLTLLICQKSIIGTQKVLQQHLLQPTYSTHLNGALYPSTIYLALQLKFRLKIM